MLDYKHLPFWSTSSEEREARCQDASKMIERYAADTHTCDQFLQRVVDLMVTKFMLYFVGIYLVDTVGQRLVLKAGTGEFGKILLERKFELFHLNTDITGEAINRNAICVDPGGGPVAGFFYLPLPIAGLPEPTLPFQFVETKTVMPGLQLLPKTRNRIAFPLRTSRQIVGVIEMHNISDARKIVPLFLPLADQVAQICEV